MWKGAVRVEHILTIPVSWRQWQIIKSNYVERLKEGKRCCLFVVVLRAESKVSTGFSPSDSPLWRVKNVTFRFACKGHFSHGNFTSCSFERLSGYFAGAFNAVTITGSWQKCMVLRGNLVFSFLKPLF